MKIKLLITIYVSLFFNLGIALGQTEYWFAVPNIDSLNKVNFTLVIKNMETPGNQICVEHYVGGASSSTYSKTITINKAYFIKEHMFQSKYTTYNCNNNSQGFSMVCNELVSKYAPTQEGLLRIYSLSGDNFDCYLETKNGNDDAIFNIKSGSGLGKKFIIPAQDMFFSSPNPVFCNQQLQKSFFVGNPSGGTINISVTPAPGKTLRYYTTGVPNTPVNFTTTQTFSIPPYGTIGFDGDSNNICGAWVESVSSNNIVVTVAEDALMASWGRDLAGDQLISVESLGKDYIVVGGAGTTSIEDVYIYGTEPNTTVTYKQCNKSNINKTIGKQEYFKINLERNKAVQITSDKPIMVYQTSGISYELGSSVIPHIGCIGSNNVIVRRGPIVTDTFYVSLVIKKGFRSSFKFERYNTSTQNWENFSINLPLKQVCNTCTYADEYEALFFEIPISELGAGQSLRVSNSMNFQMGCTYKNYDATAKFGYFSSFEIAEPKLCIDRRNYCQYEDLKFKSCYGENFVDLDIDVYEGDCISSQGRLSGSTVKLRNYNKDSFDLSELFPYLFPNKPYTPGNYYLDITIYNISRLCGDSTVCSTSRYCFPFQIGHDNDTLYVNDTTYFCDWRGSFVEGMPTCAKYNFCQNGYVMRVWNNFIEFIPIPPAKYISKTICFNEGNYNIECYDTVNCRTVITNLTVLPQAPSVVFNYDTLYYCDWSAFPYVQVPNGAKVNACNGTMPHYISDNPETQVYASVEPGSHIYYLPAGEYILYCFDTLNCRHIKTYLTIIKNYPAQYVLYDTISYCDWSQIPNANKINNSATYTACGKNMIHYVSDNPETQVFWDLNGGNEYNLTHGEYIVNCYDTANCQYIKTFLTVQVEYPVQSVLYDTLFYCELSGSCIDYTVCSSYYILSNPPPPSLPYSIPATNGVVCLGEGDYLIDCYDTLNCTYHTTYLTVKRMPAIEVYTYDTLYYCDLLHYLTYVPVYYIYGFETDTSTNPSWLYLIPSNDGTFHIEEGDYIITSGYDYDNCIIHKLKLHIAKKPSYTVVSYDTMYYCDWNGTLAQGSGGYVPYPYNEYQNLESVDPNIGIAVYNDDTYHLEEGDYIVTSYDYDSCLIYKLFLHIAPRTPTTIISYDTIYYCEPNCAMYYHNCGFPGQIEQDPYGPNWSVLSGNDGSYCLTQGDYVASCYDTFNCIIYQVSIHVSQTIVDTNYLHINLTCGETYDLDSYQPCGNSYMWSTDNGNTMLIDPIIEVNHDMQAVGKYYDSTGCLKCVLIIDIDADTVRYTSDVCWALAVSYTSKCNGGVGMRKIVSHKTGTFQMQPPGVPIRIDADCDGHNSLATYTIYGQDEKGCDCIEEVRVKCYVEVYDTICIDESNTPYILSKDCPYGSIYTSWSVKDIFGNERFSTGNSTQIYQNDKSAIFLCLDSADCVLYKYNITFVPGPCPPMPLPNGLIIPKKNSQFPNTLKYNNESHSAMNITSSENIHYKNANIQISPNPTKGIISVEIRNIKGEVLNFKVYNNIGSQVISDQWDIQADSQIEKIDLSEVVEGIYLIYIPDLGFLYKIILVK